MAEEKYCVVCGQGSHRTDWQDAEFPACDTHSKEQVATAIAKATAKPTAPKVEAPQVQPTPPGVVAAAK